jgi:hypothetical protein
MKKAISKSQDQKNHRAGRWLLAIGSLLLAQNRTKSKFFTAGEGFSTPSKPKPGLMGAPACAPPFYCSYNF